MTDYGPFSGIVSYGGMAIAAGIAMVLAFTRGSNLAPPDVGIPPAPQRVAGLLVALGVVVLKFSTGSVIGKSDLFHVVVIAAVICVVSLLAYVFLFVVLTIEKPGQPVNKRKKRARLVGGYWVTPTAKQAMNTKGIDVQQYLQGSGNNPDLVWPSASRGLAMVSLTVVYILVLVGGCFALSAAATLVSFAMAAT